MLVVNILINILILINLTLVAGMLPLIESKYLSLIQRRIGPAKVGYNGSLQFIADALNMFLNGCVIPAPTNGFYFLFYPALVLAICYLFWLNVYWGLNIIFYELEYNFVYMIILSSFVNFFIIVTGINSNNNYATLASVRMIFMTFTLELLLSLTFLNLYAYYHTFNFSITMIFQEEYPLIFVFLFGISNVILVSLMEINSSPFDLAEAESELVSGFHVEYGAFFFGLFYLGEYFHLFFFSIVLALLFAGPGL